jgi:hypothetical protein
MKGQFTREARAAARHAIVALGRYACSGADADDRRDCRKLEREVTAANNWNRLTVCSPPARCKSSCGFTFRGECAATREPIKRGSTLSASSVVASVSGAAVVRRHMSKGLPPSKPQFVASLTTKGFLGRVKNRWPMLTRNMPNGSSTTPRRICQSLSGYVAITSSSRGRGSNTIIR